MIRHYCTLPKELLARHRAKRVLEVDREISEIYAAVRTKVPKLYKLRDALTYPLRYHLPFDEDGKCEIGGYVLQVVLDEKPRRARVIKAASGEKRILSSGYATRIVVKRKKVSK